jgi:tellurite resistance protein TerC
VSGLLDRLIYLSIGLSVVLGLIGVKLILHFAHQQVSAVPEISTGVSLGLIVLVLLVTIVTSLIKSPDPGRPACAHRVAAHLPTQRR